MEENNPNLDGDAISRTNEQETLLRQNISTAITSAGSLKDVVFRTGIPRGTLEKYVAGTSTPSFLNALRIASAVGVSLEVLAGGGSKYGGVSGDSDMDRPDFVTLPIYNEIRASAGPGAAVPTTEQADGVVAFARPFLRDQGANPDRCSIIWARGDSMQPTIPDGSILVVDCSQTEVVNGCIYVLNVDDDLMVKRVRRRLDATIEIVSDNSMYPPESLRAEQLRQLRVVGRVVYLCRTP